MTDKLPGLRVCWLFGTLAECRNPKKCTRRECGNHDYSAEISRIEREEETRCVAGTQAEGRKSDPKGSQQDQREAMLDAASRTDNDAITNTRPAAYAPHQPAAAQVPVSASAGEETSELSTPAPAAGPTPRTDAVQTVWMEDGCKSAIAFITLARQLERELAAAFDHIKRDDKEIERLNDGLAAAVVALHWYAEADWRVSDDGKWSEINAGDAGGVARDVLAALRKDTNG